jgi:hypothetical protein
MFTIGLLVAMEEKRSVSVEAMRPGEVEVLAGVGWFAS